MILAFSTSSAWVSVALLDEQRQEIVWSARRLAPQAASNACVALLQQLQGDGHSFNTIDYYAADLGPGSFTGVRVGVTMAKTLAFVHGEMAGGVDSFDLISADRTVALPSKRREFFLREPGSDPIRISPPVPPDAVGFGFGNEETYPDAERFLSILPKVQWMEPERLVPAYLIEPAISLPKVPFPKPEVMP